MGVFVGVLVGTIMVLLWNPFATSIGSMVPTIDLL